VVVAGVCVCASVCDYIFIYLFCMCVFSINIERVACTSQFFIYFNSSNYFIYFISVIFLIVVVVRVVVLARRLVLAVNLSKSVSNSTAKRFPWVVVARALLIDVLAHEINKMQNPKRTEERVTRHREHGIDRKFLWNRRDSTFEFLPRGVHRYCYY